MHLENLLTQSQAAEAEAIRQAAEATQRLSAASAQHVTQLESELQQVCFGFFRRIDDAVSAYLFGVHSQGWKQYRKTNLQGVKKDDCIHGALLGEDRT